MWQKFFLLSLIVVISPQRSNISWIISSEILKTTMTHYSRLFQNYSLAAINIFKNGILQLTKLSGPTDFCTN